MENNALRIHAIILALNEETFIKPQLDTIYRFCNKISIISQYDRDWYSKTVTPDTTINKVLTYPDPEGKINLVIRRLPDEAAARNMEMLSFNKKTFRNIKSHGNSLEVISSFHKPPDYFWIIDADEIYDLNSIPAILSYLQNRKPRGMRVTGYNYVRTWNKRVPRSVVDFTHFGFIKPGILFEQRRIVSWNESRISKLLKTLRLPDFSSRIYDFITCPENIGVFHHGCWLGDNERIGNKFNKSSHLESQNWPADSIDNIITAYIPSASLPVNIIRASWPPHYFSE